MTRLIDADELCKELEDWGADLYDTSPGRQLGITDAIVIACQMPTVDAVPVRHGKWIYSNDFHWYTASCNKCGYQRRTDIKAEGWNQWKFCPNCGARMDKDETD